ncbi:MAG: type II toxin-antitoxin system HicA family toxin [Alphaproteobacteria bacterium]
MRGAEFIRAVTKIGRSRNIAVRVDEERGKGSHVTLYFGERFTVVKDRKKELPKGLLHGMLKQLGLSLEDMK